MHTSKCGVCVMREVLVVQKLPNLLVFLVNCEVILEATAGVSMIGCHGLR